MAILCKHGVAKVRSAWPLRVCGVFTAALVLGTTAACAAESTTQGLVPGSVASNTTGGATPNDVPSTGDEVTLPLFVPYVVNQNSVAPAAKAAAVRAIQKQASDSITNVTYTQYFGYLSSSAAVLVLEQTYTKRNDGTINQSGTTYDVGVRRSAGRWIVTSVTPAKPKPAAAVLTALAKSVVDNPNIQLPPAARADVESGTVANSVLKVLTELAKSHVISVSVISSAHPILVYGTNRRSDHPLGYAFDIGSIDGKLVIDPANRSLVTTVMRQAKAAGAYQVGGPVRLAGVGYFTDNTHKDHIHVGLAH